MPDQDNAAGGVVRGEVGEVAVIVAHQPGARAVAATCVRSVGTAAERPGEAGFAHLAEHLVHQYARTNAGELVEELHSRAGGVSNAQTYPFHTEFTCVVPAGSVEELDRWFAGATARLRWPDVGDVELASERAVIEQEVTHRLAASPVAGFPWIDALGCLSDDFGLAHDGFTDLADVRSVRAPAVRAFWDRTDTTASTAVGVVTPWDPAEVAGALGLVETPSAGADFRPAITGPRTRTPSVPTRLPVRAEVRWLPDQPDQPRERSRALTILAARVLDLADATGPWQTGLFGAWLGPDHGILVRRTTAAPTGIPSWPTPTVSQVEEARRGALVDLDHVLVGTATYSGLLARDAVYGLDPIGTRAHLRSVPAADVLQVLDRAARTEPGHLVAPAMLGEVRA